MPVRPQRMMRVWKAVCAWREEAVEGRGGGGGARVARDGRLLVGWRATVPSQIDGTERPRFRRPFA